jgi:hypothetical protein
MLYPCRTSKPCLAQAAENDVNFRRPMAVSWASETGIEPHSKEQVSCPHCGQALERDILPNAPWQLRSLG